MTPINPADEFLKHAAECQQMAKATRNPASKATWNRMAVRWLQCAERAKNQKVATRARARVPVRRQAEVSSAHYWARTSPAPAGLFLEHHPIAPISREDRWSNGATVASRGR